MAFKKKAVVNARLDGMSKKQLIATIKTLRRRETTLLNQVAKLAEETAALSAEITRIRGPLPQPPSGVAMDDMLEKASKIADRLIKGDALDSVQTARLATQRKTWRAGDALPAFPWEKRDDAGNGNNQTECTDVCSERSNACDQEEGA